MTLSTMPVTLKAPFEALAAASHRAGILLDPEQVCAIVSRMYDEHGQLRTFERIMLGMDAKVTEAA